MELARRRREIFLQHMPACTSPSDAMHFECHGSQDSQTLTRISQRSGRASGQLDRPVAPVKSVAEFFEALPRFLCTGKSSRCVFLSWCMEMGLLRYFKGLCCLLSGSCHLIWAVKTSFYSFIPLAGVA